MSCCVAEGDAFLVRTAPLYLGVGAILLKRRAHFSLAGHAATMYGKFPLRRCSDTDGFKPEGTAVLTTRDSITSGALSASVRPLRTANPYVAGVPTTYDMTSGNSSRATVWP